MPVISVALNQISDTTTEGHIRNHHVLIDRPEAKGGGNKGPMGGELLLAALGGCFNSNLLAAIKARDLKIDDITIEISGHLVNTPQRYEAVEMVVKSDYPDRAVLEKLVAISERSCIVANTLRDAVNLTIRVGHVSAVS
jgi:putative redox protein